MRSHTFRDFARWAFERRKHRSVSDGELRALTAVAPAFISPRATTDVLTATWVGHTTVLLQIGGVNVLTDPVWGDRASPVSFAGPKRYSKPGVDFDELPIIDLILISHDHYDHLDASTVRRLADRFPAAAWRAPLGVARFLLSHGAGDVQEMTWHDTADFCGLTLSCVPAQHFSGRGLFSRNQTLWCGWVLRSEEHAVLFAGDTALNPSFTDIAAEYGPFDLALMPIGAYDPRWFMRSVHMDPEECVEATVRMSRPYHAAPFVLATHWGTFKLTDEPLDEPPIRMKTAWNAAHLDPKKLWILGLGETRRL